MKTKNLNCKNYILKVNKNINLKKKFSKIKKEINNELNDSKKTLNILNKNYKFNFKISDLQKFKKFKIIALIGMGGSILGSEAINNFLQKKIKKKIYFFNNLDVSKISEFKKKENKKKVLFLIVSKSGNTIETLSNFFALNTVQKNSKNIIIITEKKDNLLFYLSKKFNLFYIEHKKNIGGRYSVLSEVGIVLAYLMGINIFKFRSEINEFLKRKNISFLKESSIQLSDLLIANKINNLVFLNYAPELDKFLFWCQQLIAESLGKKGKGFFPVISPAPKDHHSLLQLYLDGPKNKIFYIFSIKQKSKEKILLKKILNIKNFLDKKKLLKIKDAQKDALIQALKRNYIPFREFLIKTKNEETLGKIIFIFYS